MIFHHNPDPDPGRRNTNPPIDISRLEESITSNVETLCKHFLPEGRKVGDQWRVASSPRTGRKKNRPGSLAVKLKGKYTGYWWDWAEGTHGTFTSLVMARRGLSFPDAARAIAACLGVRL